MPYSENRNTGIIRRLINLFRKRELEVSPTEKMILPVVNLNDHLQYQVLTARNTTDADGTVTLFTTPTASRNQTCYITALTLSLTGVTAL